MARRLAHAAQLLLLALGFGGLGLGTHYAAAQGAAGTTAQGDANRFRTETYVITLPSGWRVMTRGDHERLKDDLPYELRGWAPSELTLYGAIDVWTTTGFDGSALFVVTRPGEVEMSDPGADEIARAITEWSGENGRRRRVTSREVGTVGTDDHPAIWIRTETVDADGEVVAHAVEAHVPTGGRMLILSDWTWDHASTRVAPDSPPAWSRDLVVARRPKGPGRRGEQILMAIAFGFVLAGLLLVLRQRQRARPAVDSTA